MSRNFNHCSFLALIGKAVLFLLIISRKGEKRKTKQNKNRRVHGGERTRKIIEGITEREDCLAVRTDYCKRQDRVACSSQGGSPF